MRAGGADADRFSHVKMRSAALLSCNISTLTVNDLNTGELSLGGKRSVSHLIEGKDTHASITPTSSYPKIKNQTGSMWRILNLVMVLGVAKPTALQMSDNDAPFTSAEEAAMPLVN